jgi:hypothetical protein
MNLQTDNVMKKTYLSLLFVLTAFLSGYAQTVVADPALVATLVSCHAAQQDVLRSIESSEKEIKSFQSLVASKMEQINNLQQKTYNYLSTVNAVVKNGKDIVYASQIAADIYEYQTQAANLAVNDPELTIFVLKTESELISRTADLFLYISSVALAGGESNMLDNKQRMDLCIYVVKELQQMRGLAYGVVRQLKSAKKNGVLKTLNPGGFKYINNNKRIVDNILKDLNYIKKGGY